MAKCEHAQLHGYGISGASEDLVKCFDRLPQKLVCEVAQRMGLRKAIIAPLFGFWRNASRRLKHAGHYGRAFSAYTGIPQGCALSMLMTNMVLSVWMRAIAAIPTGEGLSITAHSYVDNMGYMVCPLQFQHGPDRGREQQSPQERTHGIAAEGERAD